MKNKEKFGQNMENMKPQYIGLKLNIILMGQLLKKRFLTIMKKLKELWKLIIQNGIELIMEVVNFMVFLDQVKIDKKKEQNIEL